MILFSSTAVTKKLMRSCVLGAQSWPGNFYWLRGTEAPFPGVVSSAAFMSSAIVGLGRTHKGSLLGKPKGWKEMLLVTQKAELFLLLMLESSHTDMSFHNYLPAACSSCFLTTGIIMCCLHTPPREAGIHTQSSGITLMSDKHGCVCC